MNKKGLIQIPILIAIIVAIVLASGIGYGAIEYHKTSEIIKEAGQLSEDGKYNEAIEKLSLAQVSWFVKKLGVKRQEINNQQKEIKELTEDLSKYTQGLNEFEKGNYQEAINLFSEIPKDSFYSNNAKLKIEEAERKVGEEGLGKVKIAKKEAEEKAQQEATRRSQAEAKAKQEEFEGERSAQKENQPEGIQKAETQLESQEEIQPKTQSKPQSEITSKSQSEAQSSKQRDIELEEKSDPCANVNCPVCQYCLNGNCVARPDGYNDCGSGCQRCVNGSCQDYNDACSNCQYCESDVCINYCQETDTSCGCTDCANCNALDKCSGDLPGTEVEGVISADVTWTASESPYIAPNGILVKSNSVLTIEPGVTIKIGEKKDIVVRGALKAVGSLAKPIVFTSIYPDKHWNRMFFENKESFPESVLSYAYLYRTLGIYSDRYFPSINHSKIEGWLPLEPHSITGSLIIMNSSQAPVVFENNKIILNNRYRGNIQTALSIGNPGESISIVNNTIILNDPLSKAIGIDIVNDDRGEITVKKNTIRGNGISINLRGYWPNVNINENNLLAGGSFGGGKDYTLYIHAKDDRSINVIRNWWRTTDYSVIENRIWDRDDDISLSKADYQPIATSEIPDAGVK